MANQVKLLQRLPRELERYSPEARPLSEEEQARYDDSIKQFSGKAYDSLNVQSDLWKILHLNQIGIRTATFPELDLAIERGLSLGGHYEDGTEVRTSESIS